MNCQDWEEMRKNLISPQTVGELRDKIQKTIDSICDSLTGSAESIASDMADKGFGGMWGGVMCQMYARSRRDALYALNSLFFEILQLDENQKKRIGEMIFEPFDT